MSKFHLIGIKGAGMSALALYLADCGHVITGSDVEEYFFTELGLKAKEIEVKTFSETNMNSDMIVIVGNAFVHNEEHEAAIKKQCETYTYFEFLGLLSEQYYSIGISGSHGKTTTTNIIRQVLSVKEPVNYIVGDGEGGGNPENDLFVFEACEYKRHFLYYYPKIAVITNVDYDHPDYYKNIEDVIDAFNSYMSQSDFVVYNGDDLHLRNLMKQNKGFSFGLNEENTVYAKQIRNDESFTYFDVYYEKNNMGTFKLPLFGKHSVYNALAAITVCLYLEIKVDIIQTGLSQYKIGYRRFEEVVHGDQVIINDYAHHPTEIKATVEAVQLKYPKKEIIIYFQPHTYSRTIAFLNDFKDALNLADRVYLRHIFSSVREKNEIITIEQLKDIIDNGTVINDDQYIPVFKEIKNAVILFMGAGDIDRYYQKYLDAILNTK